MFDDRSAVGSTIREDFFIDAIEYEYCLRPHGSDRHVALCAGLDLPHEIGHRTRRRLLWRDVTVPNHAPFRYYYMWRNRLACTWEYLLRRPRAAFRDVRWLFNYTARALLYSGHPWAITRAVFAGIRDFLLGRYARMPQ